MGEFQPVLQALRAILPGAAVLAGGAVEATVGELTPEELGLVRRAAPARIAEFRAGRCYARQALAALGVPPTAILGDRRTGPLWPRGVVGSISHSRGLCVAAVAWSLDCLALGLDVERDVAMDDAMQALVCGAEELSQANESGGWPSGRIAALVFSIKESVYKAYAPTTGVFLEFKDVRVAVDIAAGTFEATIVNPEKPMLFGRPSVSGRFALCDGWLLSVNSIPPR